MSKEKLITVCDRCLMATCWQGIFMCDDARTAGTVVKSETELRALNLEHPSYWEDAMTSNDQSKVQG